MASYLIEFKDYKDEVIQLRKALSALKRGKPTDWDLEVLGCSRDEFYKDTQYMTANNFNMKERAEFIKRLEKMGVDLFNAAHLKIALDATRHLLESKPNDEYLLAREAILGNILFNGGLESVYGN